MGQREYYFLTAEFAFCSGMYDSRIPRFERKSLDRDGILMFARTSCFSMLKLQRLCIDVSRNFCADAVFDLSFECGLCIYGLNKY